MRIDVNNPRREQDRTGVLSVFKTPPVEMLEKFTIALAVAFATGMESLFRYDFGDRYYTKANYVAGAVTMFLWLLIIGGINWLLMEGFSFNLMSGVSVEPQGRLSGLIYSFFAMLIGGQYSSYAMFGGLFYLLLWLHVLFGLYHFWRMWYRNRTGQALQSKEEGKSRLQFLTVILFRPINFIANRIVVLLATIMPAKLKRNEDRLTPVFKHPQSFTQLYVEPGICFVLGSWYFSAGYGLLGLYFFLAGLGLSYISKTMLLANDGYIMDLRDQMIDQTFVSEVEDYIGDHHYSQKKMPSPRTEHALWQMAKMAEDRPEVLHNLKKSNASIVQMMEKLNPKLRNVVTARPDAGADTGEIVSPA